MYEIHCRKFSDSRKYTFPSQWRRYWLSIAYINTYKNYVSQYRKSFDLILQSAKLNGTLKINTKLSFYLCSVGPMMWGTSPKNQSLTLYCLYLDRVVSNIASSKQFTELYLQMEEGVMTSVYFNSCKKY